MTDADNVMIPQHFGNNPADIQIRVWINPEISIRIPDHFWLGSDALAQVCALWAPSSFANFHHYEIKKTKVTEWSELLNWMTS